MVDTGEYHLLFKRGKVQVQKPAVGRGTDHINIDRSQQMYHQMLSKLPQIKTRSSIELNANAVNLLHWNQPKSRQVMAMNSI